MVQFCTPVDCRCAVPFFSRTNALIYIDAYLTVSASKVAIITSLDKPNEVILYDRKADPTLVVVAKIVSYIVLAPFALLALFAKWAFRTCSPLYLRPIELLTPPNQPVKKEAETLELVGEGALVSQDQSSEIIPQLSEKQSQASLDHEAENRVLQPKEEVATVQIETTLQDATDFLTKVELREKGYVQEVTELVEQFQSLKQKIAKLTEALKDGLQSGVENAIRDVSDLHGKSEMFFSFFRKYRQSCPEQALLDDRENLDKVIVGFAYLEFSLKGIKEVYQHQNENYELQREIYALQVAKAEALELQNEYNEIQAEKIKLELEIQALKLKRELLENTP